jgi:hypothetical protein
VKAEPHYYAAPAPTAPAITLTFSINRKNLSNLMVTTIKKIRNFTFSTNHEETYEKLILNFV